MIVECENGEKHENRTQGGLSHVQTGCYFLEFEEQERKERFDLEDQLMEFMNGRIPGGMMATETDEDLTMVCINQSLFQYVSARPFSEFLEKNSKKFVDYIFKEDREKMLRQIHEQLKEKGRYEISYRIVRDDGAVFWMYDVGRYYQNEWGKRYLLCCLIDISAEKKKCKLEKCLFHTEHLYQFVEEYTKLKVWEYDLIHDVIEVQHPETESHRLTQQLEHYRECAIQEGKIHPNSVRKVHRMHERLRVEKKKVTEEICFVNESSEECWKRITYIPQEIKDGNVIRAIGICEDVTAQKEAEIRAFHQEMMWESVSQDTMYSFQVNLETMQLEMLWSEESGIKENTEQKVSYAEIYDQLYEMMANEDDKKRFSERFAEAEIENCLRENGMNQVFECRQKCPSRKIIWVSLNFRIIESPSTGSPILFIRAKNIDLIKKRELALEQKVELDPVTCLYNLQTARLLMKQMMQEKQGKHREEVLLLVDIDQFQKINEKIGYLLGDELLRQVGEQIVKELPHNAIVGRVKGDLFVAYFQSMNMKKRIAEQVEHLVEKLNGTYVCDQKTVEITVSIGAVNPGEKDCDYEMFRKRAYQSLEVAKRNGGNEVIFYSEIEEKEEETENYERELIALFRATLNKVQEGATKKNVLRKLMNYLGVCYGAEEVTLLGRTDADRPLKEVAGWCAHKHGKTKKVAADRLKYLEQALRTVGKKHFLYVDGPESPGYELMLKAYQIDRLNYPVFIAGYFQEECLTYLIVMEMCNEKVREMCVDRPMFQIIRWIDYVYQLQKNYELALKRDQNTGLNNYESFQNYLGNLNEDSLNTFGLVGVQMVDLKKYNQQYGMRKGDESLSYVAQKMVALYGKSSCYRVGRSSFFIACENMPYEEFIYCYETLQREIEEKYQDWIVIANAWENSAPNAKVLKSQVEEKLLVAQNLKKIHQNISERTVSEIKQNIQRHTQNGTFCIYLQPKADVKTKKICGAEALIRLIDREKGVISPGSFLPEIENAGLIRYIDLFVLERVCQCMKSWMAKGWKPFPISLNYSRATILEPGILYETDQIVDRYQIPKELLEIEITESISSTDNAGLKLIVETFQSHGYQIALDDYGAEYSNVYALYSLPLNTLKLDRRIINDIYHDEKARIVVENVFEICKKFKIKCVAEGVEMKEQQEVLTDMSCDIVQGYFINKPLAEEEFYKCYIMPERG